VPTLSAVACLLITLTSVVRADPPPLPTESQLIEPGHYAKKSGAEVHSPAHSRTAQCPPERALNVAVAPAASAGIVAAPAPSMAVSHWTS
jgi:hypothetical protein